MYACIHHSGGRCAELIQGKMVTAMDLCWHEDHFQCEQCARNLAGMNQLCYDDFTLQV